MSFSGTPLGQGRRLDHHTFLGKPTTRPISPHRIAPTSYAYGAPTLGTKSPPKSSSLTRDRLADNEDSSGEPALARFARLKQRDQASRGIIVSPPDPENWSVKDTSVNIATAFHQAASDMQSNNPNSSWASGSRSNINVPRSTSVEYEQEAVSTSNRRLAAPSNRLAGPRAAVPPRKTVSKSGSVQHVPDSEGEENESVAANGRGKSPFEGIADVAKRAIFYVRQRSQDPESAPPETNGKDASYDYTAEEQQFQAAQADRPSTTRRANNVTHKRNRMSTDNKAYRPSQSDLEDSEGEEDDDGKIRKRRKGKKKEPVGGPLTTLPVAGYDKRKKRKGRGSKGDIGAEEDDSDSEEQVEQAQTSEQRASVPRGSAPVSSRQSIPRGSVPPETHHDPDDSMDVEQRLNSIPEVDESDLESAPQFPPFSSQPSFTLSRSFSIGAVLGKAVHGFFRGCAFAASSSLKFLLLLLFLLGRVLGTVFDIVLKRPYQWASNANTIPLVAFGKYLTLALALFIGWYTLQNPLNFVPGLPSNVPYHAPDAPAANIAELSARLQRIENVLSGLSLDSERSRSKQESESKSHAELAGRLGALESRVQKESARAIEAEVQFRHSTSQRMEAARKDVEVLQAQIQAQAEAKNDATGNTGGSVSDEEARSRLKTLEEKVGSMDDGVKEALELGKNALKVGAASSAGAAWWNKLVSGSPSDSGLTIKATDGQDVTSLIGHLVDSAVSKYSKDTLARPDFALHSGGAMIIPSLTSPTFEMRPLNLRGQLLGLVTGHGYAIGRPPVTVLHHELHNGNCWPFAGSQGQLGVALAAPAYISDISIDHVAREVAFDMRSAPREMEVWAMVEGKDNIAKVKAWHAEKAARKEERRREAEERGEGESFVEESDGTYPKSLPKSPQYLRIAEFSYNIHAPQNVQTFPVSQEIRDLGVDFGIVVLVVKSNWGRDDYTCLYRLRVHGQRMGEIPLPYPEEAA